MRHLLASFSLTLLLATPGPTQGRTWVVDAAGGPGSQFTEIQPAVDAAASGDRILVRRGTYAPFRIHGKGVAVLGRLTAFVLGSSNTLPIEISGVPADTSCTVHGIGTHFLGSAVGLLVRNCAGDVQVSRVADSFASEIVVEDSASVLLQDLGNNLPRLIVRRSKVVAESCRFAAGRGSFVDDRPAVGVEDAELVLAGCDVSAGGRIGEFSNAPIGMTRSRLVLTDDGSHRIQAGQVARQPSPAIVGDGGVAIDPRVVLEPTPGAPAIGAGLRVVRNAHIPWLTGLPALTGSTARAELRDVPAAAYALALGLAGGPVVLPGVFGAGHLDPAATLVVAVGTLDGTGFASASLSVPAVPALVGAPLVWQAMTDDAGGTDLAWSNPLPLVIVR